MNMKKERIISLMLALTATAMTVRAQEPVRIISSNFPDANFREIVKGNDIDKNQDGWLETGELAAVTTLTVRSKSIESLKGVEHFYKLTTLICDDNRLSSLDVSKITTLKALYCSQNRLTSLDVSKNTALTILYCYSNKLTSLDLSNNKALTALTCYLNRIGHSDMLKLVNSLPTVTNGNFCGISISSSTEKNVLAKSRVEIAQGKGWSVKAKDGSSNVDYEGSDYLIAIDATNFPDENFRTVVAGTKIDKDADGKLSEEEIAAVTQLTTASLKNIASLKGIEFFTALKRLWCENNQLTTLDVSKNSALTELDCYNNQLTTLDVSKNTALTSLYCYNNQLTSLDVSKNTALIELSCGWNQLTSLDVSKNTALTQLVCGGNQLTSIDVSKNSALTALGCYGNQLTSLDVSKNTALTQLACFGNQIKEDQMQALVNSLPTVTEGDFYVIDTKDSNEQNVCTKEQVAIATGKGWTVGDYNGGTPEVLGQIAIDATNFPDENFCNFVAGTSIDKDANGYLSDGEIAAVTQLDVSQKNIASLKGIEFFTALTELVCYVNELTSLDVSKNTALKYLCCHGNHLTSLDVSKNTALKYLDCYGNQLTSLDVSKNTALQLLGCFGNQIKGEQMQALVNSLPTVTEGDFWVIDTKSSYEQNVCTKDQVAIAKGKGWTVYDYNGGSRQEYAGSVVTAIRSIEVSAEENGLWYTLDGKRLSGKPTQKGIYIHNGKKVVIK
jgi:Leucine-rich repeat (LRR) protein